MRRHYDEDDYDRYDEIDNADAQLQEAEDIVIVVKKIKIPTLREIRRHIKQHAWNGQAFTYRDSNYDVFVGQCEYASTAISEILTGTGLHGKPVNWSLRVRGWYSGDLSAILGRSGCDEHARTHGRHCHSWVEYGGKIIDPTFWQFADDPVRVYVFDLDDPRYDEPLGMADMADIEDSN